MIYKIGVLKYLLKFTIKHLRWSLFLINFRPQCFHFYYKETREHVFTCEFCEILRTPFNRRATDNCFCLCHLLILAILIITYRKTLYILNVCLTNSYQQSFEKSTCFLMFRYITQLFFSYYEFNLCCIEYYEIMAIFKSELS